MEPTREPLDEGGELELVTGRDGHATVERPAERAARKSESKDYPICGSPKRGGGICQKRCMVGRNRCRLHGGLSPRGADSPHFKHGLYSRVLPKHLRGDFASLMSDPALLEGRAELSILQLRMRELIARLETGESAASWARAQEAFGRLKQAEEDGDDEARADSLTELGELLESGTRRERAWEDASEFIERLSKVSERESKRVAREQQTATADEVRLLVQSITNAVMLHVTDESTRAKIAEHVNRLRIVEPINPQAGEPV